MKLERDILQALIEYLVSHGYPEESFAIEWPIGKYSVDLAIVDPQSKEPVALFEVKSRKSPGNQNMGKEQLQRYIKALGKRLPTYLVYRSDSSNGLDIERVEFGNQIEELDRVSAQEVMQYSTLRRSSLNTSIASTKTKHEKVFDWFWFACWFLAVVLIVLSVLDFAKVLTLSASQLTLMGACIALILIPFASKLKILGIEFERLQKESSKDS